MVTVAAITTACGRRRGLAAALSLLLPVLGCHPQPGLEDVRERLVFTEDFEHLDGWLPDATSLTTERAHSGRYAVKVDKEHPYSLTYRLVFGKTFTQRPRLLRLSAWVWVHGAADDARLLTAITPPDPNAPALSTTPIYVADNWPYRRWTHVSRDIVIPPPGYPSSSNLVIYLWNLDTKHPVYADDWTLTEIH
jgi:hypothetical protein